MNSKGALFACPVCQNDLWMGFLSIYREEQAIEIQPVFGSLDASVHLPGSKSLTNRALLCAALADGQSELRGALVSDDTRVMVAGLTALGFTIEADWPNHCLIVTGSDGQIPADTATIDCRASGTTMRFLAAATSLGHGRYRLDGTSRMRQRPIGDLLVALRALGIKAEAESPGECPPVTVTADGVTTAAVTIAGNTSSQFASSW